MPQSISNLPVGAKIKDVGTNYYNTPIIWQIAAKNHSGYPSNSVTLITERIIKQACVDGKEPSNSNNDRKLYGNNRFIHSNMRQWLNSNDNAGAWYTAQHSADAPPSAANCWDGWHPYDTQAGFLTNFSNDFINALLTTSLTVARNTVTKTGTGNKFRSDGRTSRGIRQR